MTMNILVTTDYVRALSGIKSTTDISDNDLMQIIYYAQRHTLRDIHRKHTREEPDPNPDTGSGIDGSNTTFRTKGYPIADMTFDETTDASDISGVWIDEDWGVQTATVTITSADYGIVDVTQSDGTTAVPSTAKYIYLTYYEESNMFDRELLIEAAAYLAAHMAQQIFTSQDKITLADLEGNKQLIKQGEDRFLKLYERIVRDIGFPGIGGT